MCKTEEGRAGPDCVNCKAVNVLGDLYGRMIYFRQDEVALSSLSDKEKSALSFKEAD